MSNLVLIFVGVLSSNLTFIISRPSPGAPYSKFPIDAKSFKKLKQFLPGYKGLRIPLKYKEYSGVVSVGGFNYEKPYYLKEVIYKK